MKKQTIAITAVIILSLTAVAFYQFLQVSKTKQEVQKPQPEISRSADVIIASPVVKVKGVDVVIVDDKGKKTEGNFPAGNAFEALEKLAKANNLQVEVKQFKFGGMVVRIGDKANSQDFAWTYLVNGKPGQVAADRYMLYQNDKVEWVYKKN
jgi:hypothetical protein